MKCLFYSDINQVMEMNKAQKAFQNKMNNSGKSMLISF